MATRTWLAAVLIVGFVGAGLAGCQSGDDSGAQMQQSQRQLEDPNAGLGSTTNPTAPIRE